MAAIRIRCYGALSQIPLIKGDKKRIKHGIEVRIAEPVMVRDVLMRLQVPLQHVRLLFVEKHRVMLDSALKDGDTLHVFPVMAGG